MKRVQSLLGIGLAGLAITYFVIFVAKHISTTPALDWDFAKTASLASATVVYSVTVVINGYSWYLFLEGSGEKRPVVEVITIFSIGQFAKYIPGNVAPHIGRLALTRSIGYRSSRVLLVIVMETVWSVLAGSLLANFSLIASGRTYFSRFPGGLPL